MVSKELQDLLLLAKDKSSQSRSRLVENITDLFLSEDGRLSEHERMLMSDILGKLISQVETSIRKELADALSDSSVDFPEIALQLANDEASIARPLLERSQLLQEPDLIDIVKRRTDEHRIAVAMRSNVSERVSDALVEYGNEDVIEALLKNKDAHISEQALEYLVAESRRVDCFQEPLVQRSDLPADLAYQMYWWVSAALRKDILSNFDVDPIAFDSVVRRATAAAMKGQDDNQSAYHKAAQLVRRLAESGQLTIQFLVNALRQQRIIVFVAGIAELGDVTFSTAWRIFSDRGGESFAILAKAIGIDKGQFASLYLLVTQARDGDTIKSPGVLNDILELFNSTSEKNAQGALQIWQRESAYQEAIEQLDKAV